MTKKDFELIAQVFAMNDPASSYAATATEMWHVMRSFMADALAENPKFNRDKFLDACEFANLKRV